MILHILSNFLGYFISSLILLQYLGSNGYVLNTGTNHTLILQCLICIISMPCFYVINKNNALKIIGVLFCFFIFVGIHYEIISRLNNYFFDFMSLWGYAKFCFYLFVFLVLYYYFRGKDFLLISKFVRFIVIILFLESLLYLALKTLGLNELSRLFILDSGGSRFAGIFMMNNSLVGLLSLFVMSNVIFFGSVIQKYFYISIATLLIFLAGERSIFLGYLFFMFGYLLFSYDASNDIFKVKIRIFSILAFIFLGFIVLYTLVYRDYAISSVGSFLRPLLIRIYFSYLSIVHLFESGNTIFGFGPFINLLPINVADMHADYVEKFIKAVSNIFGHAEKIYFASWHDSGNPDSASYTVNAHNTFVLLFYQFGYSFICVLLYFIFIYYFSLSYIKQYLKEISFESKSKDKQDINENYFQLSSLIFIFACIPPLFFLSMNNFLLLVIIAFGHIGSLRFKVNNE